MMYIQSVAKLFSEGSKLLHILYEHSNYFYYTRQEYQLFLKAAHSITFDSSDKISASTF